jgi:hypothetical protein
VLPIWLDPGWKPFIAEEKETVKEIRGDIRELATQTGLDVTEFRRIVNKVQKGRARSSGSPRRKWSKPICAW